MQLKRHICFLSNSCLLEWRTVRSCVCLRVETAARLRNRRHTRWRLSNLQSSIWNRLSRTSCDTFSGKVWILWCSHLFFLTSSVQLSSSICLFLSCRFGDPLGGLLLPFHTSLLRDGGALPGRLVGGAGLRGDGAGTGLLRYAHANKKKLATGYISNEHFQ